MSLQELQQRHEALEKQRDAMLKAVAGLASSLADIYDEASLPVSLASALEDVFAAVTGAGHE